MDLKGNGQCTNGKGESDTEREDGESRRQKRRPLSHPTIVCHLIICIQPGFAHTHQSISPFRCASGMMEPHATSSPPFALHLGNHSTRLASHSPLSSRLRNISGNDFSSYERITSTATRAAFVAHNNKLAQQASAFSLSSSNRTPSNWILWGMGTRAAVRQRFCEGLLQEISQTRRDREGSRREAHRHSFSVHCKSLPRILFLLGTQAYLHTKPFSNSSQAAKFELSIRFRSPMQPKKLARRKQRNISRPYLQTSRLLHPIALCESTLVPGAIRHILTPPTPAPEL